jgi:hypothetical protein
MSLLLVICRELAALVAAKSADLVVILAKAGTQAATGSPFRGDDE